MLPVNKKACFCTKKSKHIKIIYTRQKESIYPGFVMNLKKKS